MQCEAHNVVHVRSTASSCETVIHFENHFNFICDVYYDSKNKLKMKRRIAYDLFQ